MPPVNRHCFLKIMWENPGFQGSASFHPGDISSVHLSLVPSIPLTECRGKFSFPNRNKTKMAERAGKVFCRMHKEEGMTACLCQPPHHCTGVPVTAVDGGSNRGINVIPVRIFNAPCNRNRLTRGKNHRYPVSPWVSRRFVIIRPEPVCNRKLPRRTVL